MNSLHVIKSQSTHDHEQAYEAGLNVLGFMGDSRGYRPGGFFEKLLEAWTHADQTNKARLAIAFPYYAAALDTYWNHGADALAEEVL